jgi:hypothetical protein
VVITPGLSSRRRILQPGDHAHQPQSSQRASQLCCNAAQLFMTLRCNCWRGLHLQTVSSLADQAAQCAQLSSGDADIQSTPSPAAVRV